MTMRRFDPDCDRATGGHRIRAEQRRVCRASAL